MTTTEEFASALVAAVQKHKDESPTCMPIRRPQVEFAQHLGWSFGLNAHAHPVGAAARPDCPEAMIWHYQMSAKLIGSKSAEEEWRALGTVVAAVHEATGCPAESGPEDPILPIESAHPNSSLVWLWHSDGSDVDQAVFDGTRRALVTMQAAERKLAVSGGLAMPLEKVGRNKLCPCGSGKKFKKCHGGAN
jgi:hypothetical protein